MKRLFSMELDGWKWTENIAIFGLKDAAKMAYRKKVPFEAFYFIAFGRYPSK